MPQYAYTINGQRHVFEGPDPQTTARFAQRWAATQPVARAPVPANDERPQLGPQRSQFAMDVGARAKQDVADLTGAIGDVRAHPTSLLNGPKILSAVARYVPNALGLVPAAGVDQVTGPVVRGINSRFGTHFDPRYATDQILNAASLLSGAGETSAAERFERLGGGRLASGATKLRQASVRIPPPKLSVVPSVYGPHTPEEMAPEPEPEEIPVVPLTNEFLLNHQQRARSLENLPQNVAGKYRSAVDKLVIDPILEDPDYGGHNPADVEYIRDRLAKMAAGQRKYGGNIRLADALDSANEDFRTMVIQEQPKVATRLGLIPPADAVPAAATPEPNANPPSAQGEIINFAQHKPGLGQADDGSAAAGSTLAPDSDPTGRTGEIVSFRPTARMPGLTGPDSNAPAASIPDTDVNPPDRRGEILSFGQHVPPAEMGGVGGGPINLAGLSHAQRLVLLARLQEMAASGDPLVDSARAGLAGRVKTAAQDGLAWMKGAYSGAGQAAMNAFSGPASFAQAMAARAPNLINGLDFNALKPPEWLGPTMVGVASQPKNSQQPQN